MPTPSHCCCSATLTSDKPVTSFYFKTRGPSSAMPLKCSILTLNPHTACGDGEPFQRRPLWQASSTIKTLRIISSIVCSGDANDWQHFPQSQNFTRALPCEPFLLASAGRAPPCFRRKSLFTYPIHSVHIP